MKRGALLAAALLTLPASAQLATRSYQGLWWNAPAGSESGWGVNITHQGDILFATWFTYDADGSGLWLVMPRGELVMADGEDIPDPYDYGYGMPMPSQPKYAGALYRTTGPAFDAATFDPAAVTVAQVGMASFRFSGADAGTFEFNVNGMARTKPITRQVFSTMPACDLGGAAGAQPNFQDLWWRSPAGTESGWGVNVAHQGDTLFATWFTYDASGRGLWLVMPSGVKTGERSYSGALYRTTGPAFSAAPWTASQVTVTAVGNATFQFSDAANGVFSATVGAVSTSKAITRQVFASPTTVCR